jgi:hypothetical protein
VTRTPDDSLAIRHVGRWRATTCRIFHENAVPAGTIIAETIFYTELFHAMRAKSIRNKKSFRDN